MGPTAAQRAGRSLHRSYRRLMYAYPRGYRRTRGLEILTTLLDAAPPERSRATAGEAADLVLGGIRYRLAVPGAVARAVAVVVALVAGLVVSGVAAWGTWQATTVTPSIEDSSLIARLAAGQEPTQILVDPGDPVQADVLGMGTAPIDEGYTGPAPAPAVVHLGHRTSSTDVAGVLEPARAKLAAAGWRTTEPVFGDHMGVAWAVRGDRVVRLEARLGTGQPGDGGTWTVGDPVVLWVSVHATASNWVTVVSLLGFLAGLVLGWLAAAWAVRAYGRHGSGGRAVMLLLAVPTVFVAVLGLLGPAALTGVSIGLRDGWSPQDSLLGMIVLRNGWPFAVLVVLGLAALAVTASLARDRGSGAATSVPSSA